MIEVVVVVLGVGVEEMSEGREKNLTQMVVAWLQEALQERNFETFTEDVSSLHTTLKASSSLSVALQASMKRLCTF